MRSKLLLPVLLGALAVACAQEPATQQSPPESEPIQALQVTYYFLPG